MTGENPTSIADEMGRRATVFIETSEKYGYNLDYSAESLARLEDLIDDLFADPRPWRRGKTAKQFANMAPVVGAYLGEVLVRELGGRWAVHDDHGEGVVLSERHVDLPRC